MAARTSRVFSGTLADLRRMSEWFQGLATTGTLSPDAAWQAELCLNEAASNIILHGYEDGAPHPITIDIAPVERGIQMTISDNGRPFDPSEPRELPAARALEETPLGGLGLHLIRSFADDVRYRREADRNVLELTFASP
jgi:anti-sigma regulatory factor (Ser/Thr protein kinase)